MTKHKKTKVWVEKAMARLDKVSCRIKRAPRPEHVEKELKKAINYGRRTRWGTRL